MIIMALDHTREFVGNVSMFQPEVLKETTPLLFLTRWITHFCAPVFMFTAGIGAYLKSNRDGASATSKFLLTRGLWLVFLEVSVLRFALQFNMTEGAILLTILWALGWCMVALSILSRLPVRVLAALSVATIVLHNLLDGLRPEQFGAFSWLWKILHQQGVMMAGSVPMISAYPLVPWIAVMAAGYCMGPVMLMDSERRRRILIRLGAALTLAFLVIRAVNVYGDPRVFAMQPTAAFSVISFLNTTKYPPSLDFLLMTLGPAILALGLIDRIRAGAANPALIFGRVPLFYFLGHIFVVHLLAVAIALVRYGTAGFLLHEPPSREALSKANPQDFGFGLGGVYLSWLAVVVIMYPLCLWFARLKQRRRDWWLGYL